MNILQLAPYAARSILSRGRQYDEPKANTRTEYQRDRDRIIHSGAFRRLEYKTQVFANHEGDLFRTRLTHSLEVAQIARSGARNLQLNEDLVEAIALAHDLGHTPFGHAGQDALNECMEEHGGFEHNLQSLRVVDVLEERYGTFDGLNLTFETREGILKHCSLEDASLMGDLGKRFLEGKQPSLEAQLANLADEIAYNTHDIDDGLRAGLLSVAQLKEVDLYGRYWHEVQSEMPGINDRRGVYETIRRMISVQVIDLREASNERIHVVNPLNLDDVRNAPPLIAFSEGIAADIGSLKRFLHENLYRHYQVNRMSSKARHIIQRLFHAFMDEPDLLPPEHQSHDGNSDVQTRNVQARDVQARDLQARWVSDYIASMTDRYAMREYRKLFEVDVV